jgi:transcriptional regulator with XRE-family HTH domain
MTLGERVKEKRVALGWSQAELARRVSKILRRKITQVAIHHIEVRGDVSPRFVVELAQALNVSLPWLQHGREPTAAARNVVDFPLVGQKNHPTTAVSANCSPEIYALIDLLVKMPEGSAEEKAVIGLIRMLQQKQLPAP